MLTNGKIAFAICFALVFVAAMIWSYKKDSANDKSHFAGVSRTLALILLAFIALFLFVKMRHYI